MSDSEILAKVQSFGDSLTHQAKFLRKSMNMCKCLFILSMRQGLWNLHLSSLTRLLNISLHTIKSTLPEPLNQTNMLELKTKDKSTWNYLEQNFAINKSKIPFTSTGSDLAMEQENKKMKVSGGVIYLTAQVLNSIL